MPLHKYLVITKFECVKPRTFRKMSQDTSNRENIGVSVSRLGRWCFNTRTHVMTQAVFGEQDLAKVADKLTKRKAWYKVVPAA